MSHSHSRAVRPAQLLALLLAFLSVSSLMGVVTAGMLVPVAGPTALVAKSVPSVFNELPGDLQTVAPAEESQLLDSSGGVIAHFYDKQRIVVPSSHIADVMKKAIVAIEDKRFYGHEEVIHIARYQRGDERTIYNVMYRDGKVGAVYAKRFNVLSIIRDRIYDLTRGKDRSRILYFSANTNGEAEKVSIKLKIRNARQRLFQFEKDFSDLPIKTRSSVGLLVTKAEVHSITLLSKGFSTLGGRDVWFDRDVMRLNYNGQGTYLGSFHARDHVLIILTNGECYTTDFSDSIHIEENLLRIEKHQPQKLWTAVYYNAKSKREYIKRFTIEAEQRREQILGDNPDNKLLILTDTYYPRLSLGRKDKNGELQLTELDVETFIQVKGIRAQGNQLAKYPLDLIEELPPLKEGPTFEEEEPEGQPQEEEEDLFPSSDFETATDDTSPR